MRAHLKTHDEKRYTCAHPSCASRHYFSTWTELQSHNRTTHPATCPYESCKGKTFAQQKGLKAHLKLHEQRDLELALHNHLDGEHDADVEDSGAEDTRSAKRRRGGEVGRDWKCTMDDCTKDFKSVCRLALYSLIGTIENLIAAVRKKHSLITSMLPTFSNATSYAPKVDVGFNLVTSTCSNAIPPRRTQQPLCHRSMTSNLLLMNLVKITY